MFEKVLNKPQHSDVLKWRYRKIRNSQASLMEESMPEHIFPRGKRGVFYADCRYMGVRIRDSLGTTDRRLAERRLANLKSSVERGEYLKSKMSFVELANQYMGQVLPQKSDHSQERYGKIVTIHLCPFFKDKLLVEIDLLSVVEFKLHREKGGAKPSTLKKELRVLKDIIRLADRAFELPKPDEFPLMKWANKPKQFDKSMILEESEVIEVSGLVLEAYRKIFLIAIYSGLRLGDVVSLCPRDVDLKEGMIGKYQGKTSNWVAIPVCEKLRKVFSTLIWPLDKHRSFFPGVSSKAVSTEVRRAFKKSGLEEHSFKSLRHFAATHLINGGIPVEVIQDFMGHQNITTTMIYAKVKRGTLKKIADVFDQGQVSTNCPQVAK
ncbi:MAG: tyrosine-type recombinase/integrase [Nitrospinaceae bacterium]|nr:tyrosine-type recombinase/integrase [Nitrospinaceae bacterium]